MKLWQACKSGERDTLIEAISKGADTSWTNPNFQVCIIICTPHDTEQFNEKEQIIYAVVLMNYILFKNLYLTPKFLQLPY